VRDFVKINVSLAHVYYLTRDCSIKAIKLNRVSGNLSQIFSHSAKNDLIVINETGYLPLNDKAANPFIQLVVIFTSSRSIIIASNWHFNEWGATFNDYFIAPAVLDRSLHNFLTITMFGDSFSIKHLKEYKVYQFECHFVPILNAIYSEPHYSGGTVEITYSRTMNVEEQG
jgi:DNA replication protein DnaC